MHGDRGWHISGAKHFGSGTGISSFMLPTAVAEGDEGADWFFVPMGGRPLDGTAGVTLTAPWDGHGMAATQSLYAFYINSGMSLELMLRVGAVVSISAAAGRTTKATPTTRP